MNIFLWKDFVSLNRKKTYKRYSWENKITLGKWSKFFSFSLNFLWFSMTFRRKCPNYQYRRTRYMKLHREVYQMTPGRTPTYVLCTDILGNLLLYLVRNLWLQRRIHSKRCQWNVDKFTWKHENDTQRTKQ